MAYFHHAQAKLLLFYFSQTPRHSTAFSNSDDLHTTSSAAALIANCSVYDGWCSYRPLSGIAVGSRSICLFTVSNWSLPLMPEVCYKYMYQLFRQSLCFVVKWYIIQ